MEQECKYIVYFNDNLVSKYKSCKSNHTLWEMNDSVLYYCIWDQIKDLKPLWALMIFLILLVTSHIGRLKTLSPISS